MGLDPFWVRVHKSALFLVWIYVKNVEPFEKFMSRVDWTGLRPKWVRVPRLALCHSFSPDFRPHSLEPPGN